VRLPLVALAAVAGLLAVAASITACASDDADPLSLEDAVGQMLLIGFRGETLYDETTALLDEIAPGGVILFDYDGPSGGEQVRNIVSPDQLKALIADLQEASERPLLIAIDAEGGFVNRLKEDYGFEVQLPSHLAMGAGTSTETESLAGASARQLSDLGINWNLAPVVDVNVFPESPAIGYWERSFSDDPDAVADHAAAFARAHHDQGVVSTLKHFPGHLAPAHRRVGRANPRPQAQVRSHRLADHFRLDLAPYPGQLCGIISVLMFRYHHRTRIA